MKPRSVRYMEDAKCTLAIAILLLTSAVAASAFAVAAWIAHDEWPMTGYGAATLILAYFGASALGRSMDQYKASEREEYWENRRLAERFIDAERI